MFSRWILSFVVLWMLFLLPSVSRAAAPASLQSNLMNPLIGLTGMCKGQAAKDLAREEGGETSFGLQAAELTVESVVDPHFKLNANLVFAEEEVCAEEVYATTRSLPQVQGRIGKFKASFGKLGTVHAHAFPFILQALPYEATIGGEGFNGGGGEVSWMTPLPWFFELTTGVFSAVEQGETPRDWSGARKDDLVYQVRARNFFDLSRDATLEVGSSLLSGHTAQGLSQRVVGIDLTFKHAPALNAGGHPWTFQSEWLRKDLGSSKEQEGWYTHLQYRLVKEWWLGARIERAYRLPTLDENGDKSPFQGSALRRTMELTWAPSEFTSIRADFCHAVLGTEGGDRQDRRAVLQFVHTIGTHPAHSY